MDFKTQRREGFIQWYRWSLENEDCDPTLYMLNYLFNRYEHNVEQRLWVCWLFGGTYYAPTAWVIWNEFPDMELVGLGRIDRWNSENYRRLRYQVDTRYNKGHLPKMFQTYKEWVGGKTQKERILSFREDDPVKYFWNLWGEVRKHFFKFGRYSTWFYLQTLRKCAGVPVEAPHLMLEDYEGSKSHRNGLCKALGKDDWYDAKLDKTQIAWLNDGARDILAEMKARYPSLDCEYFGMESCLCSYKKTFRVKDGRYLGYYLDRQAEEISQVENDGWHGIDWRPWWEARKEMLNESLTKSNKISKHLMVTGQFSRYQLEAEEDIFDLWGVK